MKVTERIRSLAQPVVEEHGCTLWDVEYVGVNINDCVEVSHAMDPILDREDPIEGSYRFEVVSAGLERPLKRPSDFAAFLGAKVLVKLYRPLNGVREYPAVLRGYDNGDVTVEYGGETLTFSKAQVALVRLRADFD